MLDEANAECGKFREASCAKKLNSKNDFKKGHDWKLIK